MFKYLFNFFVTLCCLVSFASYSLDTPSTPSASVSGKTVTLSWGTVSGAVYYQLGYRDGYGSWGTSYGKYYNGSQTWPNAPYLIQRSYRMRACDNATCYGWSGASNQINILPPKLLASVNWSPANIQYGQSSTLSWSSSNASSCKLDGSNKGLVGNWNSVNNTANKETYFTCVGEADQTITVSASLIVDPPPKLTGNVSWTPSSIRYGGSSELSWSSNNALSCQLDNSNIITTGNKTYSDIKDNITIAFACSGIAGQQLLITTTLPVLPIELTVLPEAPVAKVNGKTLVLTWKQVEGATYYELEYRDGSGDWKPSYGNYRNGTHSWPDAPALNQRSYRMRACNNSSVCFEQWSQASNAVTIYPKPDAPTNLEASFTENTTTLTWKEVPYADYFKVQYHDGDGNWDDSDTRLKGVKQVWSTPFTQVRYYRLSGCNTSGCSDWSDASVVKLSTPMNLKLSNVVNGIELTWDVVIGADSYKLQYRDGEGDWTAAFGTYYAGSKIWENETAVFNRSYRLSACNQDVCSELWSLPSTYVENKVISLKIDLLGTPIP
ncbi:hypothetical protein CJF42_25775 [Pseudoalteromonas sp. NBT06-2]|uniref:hypothetical protein n=1 Tax=Pseudoalteromonas sp. NBT06-2 TaxID=2025950 RepID=UPI000BA4F86D|nr:hypothetical protein [Pseudoalteromonas sp. NBT06-2]PAJ71586.1 hypothetical protein CJF42_25775 [Pseudoalteromonas sp. NBT06-2]